MSKENEKKTGSGSAIPDETLEQVSAGWIPDGLYYLACQLFTDDIFQKHLSEGMNNTCPEYRGNKEYRMCHRCINLIRD